MTKPAGWSAAATAPERALPAGTRVDDYEIEQTLAEGDVAIVYRAFDHALGMQVALEEYMPEAMALRCADGRVVLRTRVQGHAFEEGRQAFVGEAQTLARCAHPALLRIDRVLQRNGTAYRAMRLCTGPSLLEHRRALAGPPVAATLQRWLEDLLGALEALHDEGCVHGALAPGRILLRDGGHLRRDGGHLLLLGFDAVRFKLISGRTQDMMAALEPSFAAPELRSRSSGPATGPWTDLYALATTLRYCIDGELPTPAAGFATARAAGLASVAWRRVAREAGTEFDADAPWLGPIDACLTEAPQDRPQSVAQLRRMIDEALFASTMPAWPAPRIAPVLSDGVGDAPVLEDGAEGISAQMAIDVNPAPRPEAESAGPEAVAPAPATDEIAPDPKRAPEAASAPIDSPVVADAAIAHMLVDLDQTLARVAAMAGEETDPQRLAPALAPATSNAHGSESAPAAKPPAPWRRELRALWQHSPAMWLGVAVVAATAIALQIGQGERPADGPASIDAAPIERAALPPPPAATLPPPPAATLPPPPSVTAGTQGEPSSELAPEAVAADVEPVAPETPLTAAAQKSVPAASPRPAPRAACTGKSGYALYQCMQTQCAKRAYTKHPQCVRLGRDQKLG